MSNDLLRPDAERDDDLLSREELLNRIITKDARIAELEGDIKLLEAGVVTADGEREGLYDRIDDLEQCIREASSYLLSGHGVGHLAQPCLQDMIDKMDKMERSNQ